MRKTLTKLIAVLIILIIIVLYLPFSIHSKIPSFTLIFFGLSKDIAGILDPAYTKEVKTYAIDQERAGYQEKLDDVSMQMTKAKENLKKSEDELSKTKGLLAEENNAKEDPKIKNWKKIHEQKIQNLTTDIKKAEVRIEQNKKSIASLQPDVDKYQNFVNEAKQRFDELNKVTFGDSIVNWIVFIGVELCVIGFTFIPGFLLFAIVHALFKDNFWGVQFIKFTVGIPLIGWIMMDRINNGFSNIGNFLIVCLISAVVFAPFWYLDKLTKEYVNNTKNEIKRDIDKALEAL
ncbi:MAG: hypothetical protein JXA60_05350 [Candidatus Coatesbacteria bacterium]|nr:hypothetical protein [Candidatus Coatesbacteria bacterium]